MSQIEDTHPSRVSREKLLLSQQSQRLVEDWALPGDRFMQNKANLPEDQIDAKLAITMAYGDSCGPKQQRNKANSNPNRANFCISSSVHRL